MLLTAAAAAGPICHASASAQWNLHWPCSASAPGHYGSGIGSASATGRRTKPIGRFSFFSKFKFDYEHHCQPEPEQVALCTASSWVLRRYWPYRRQPESRQAARACSRPVSGSAALLGTGGASSIRLVSHLRPPIVVCATKLSTVYDQTYPLSRHARPQRIGHRSDGTKVQFSPSTISSTEPSSCRPLH
jgi:hypothetical protein